jgi:hypothetical protein
MKRTGLISGIVVLLMVQVTYGLSNSDFEDYGGYEIITDSNGIQKINVFKRNNPVALFTLNIDGSLLCEYVMARLLHMHNIGLRVNYEAGTPEHFRFTYAGGAPVQNFYARNMGAIGFYENGVGGVTLEVFLDADMDGVLDPAETTPTLFHLNPGYSSKEKLKFDYMVSALVNYLIVGNGNIEIVTDGIRFKYDN